ncbi:MAG: hypothetical protein HN542_06390 [Flavobacteriales bacterium]|nr:hypothetical protein [Flavobacteriales bacterium]NCG30834.1 hypothetical protein [Bacteroidota bacterium]MBT4705240.1 hypothetical protein [Flavobacteriales bacterium]MBT4931315.1 hypothetical protein [Flavobacteriales bacterium]MBT5133000.1 hypothetical protein [Flavobacteriales bacterium]
MRKIGIGVAFLFVITLITFWVLNNQSSSTIKSELTDFAVQDTAVISKITLEDETGVTVVLDRNEKGWIVNQEFIARPDAVRILLTTMSKLSVKSPVSQQGMNSVLKNIIAKHTLIKIYTSSEEADKAYYVGGPDQTHTGTLMLMKGSSRPFITHLEGFHGFLTTRYFTNVLEWRHRGIFEEQIHNIDGLNISFPADSSLDVDISRNETTGSWTVSPSSSEIDTFLLMAYLKKYELVHYESFEETKSPEFLDSIRGTEPLFQISLRTFNHGAIGVTGFKKPIREGYDPEGNAIGYDLDRLYLQLDNGEMVIGQYAIFDPLTKGIGLFR